MRTFLLATLGVLSSACLGPNPWYKGETDESDSVGDGDGELTGDGDGEPTGDGDGDGDGEPTGDGDGESTDDGDPCNNGRLDGDETDLDCGGSCSPCDPGANCQIETDCNSGVCTAGSCAAPSCEDEVHNGDELELDCGGSCRFCQHSNFVSEFDDFENNDSLVPGVAMFEDGSFGVLYVGLQSATFRVRWFTDLAAPLGLGLQLTAAINMPVMASQALVAGDLATHRVYAAINGLDANSSNRDAFMVERGPNSPAKHWSIYQGSDVVSYADLAIEDDISTFVWQQNNNISMRRRDFGVDDNEFIDALALEVDPASAQYHGREPTVTRRDGMTVIAWVRYPANQASQGTVALRRFDGIWLELNPVTLADFSTSVRYPQVAIGEDGRVALVFFDETAREVWAAIFAADLELEGDPWRLQHSLPQGGFTPSADVVALEDGTFAFAWPDGNDNRVHIRRFVAADTPLVTNVGDEAPWPTTDSPVWVRLSTANNLVVAIWSARHDGVFQIQGQVLSY